MQLRFVAALAILLVGALLRAPASEASWPANGVTVGGSQAQASYGMSIPDGSGGWFVAWSDYRSNPIDEVRLQHLLATGDPAPGWTQEGILVKGGPTKNNVLGALAQDGQGGTLVAWHDDRQGFQFDVYVQRYMSDGSIAPGWPVGGVRATTDPNQQQDAQVCSDGAGGAFVVWSDDRFSAVDGGRERPFCQHIIASGAIASGWPVDGLQVCSKASGLPRIMTDGSGGCFVAWEDLRRGGTFPNNFDVYGQRLFSDGRLAPGWQVDGNLIAQGRGMRSNLFPDGVGGFYAASAEFTTQSGIAPARFWISRFAPNGVPAAGWSPQGVPMQATLTFREDLHCAADSLGGVFACWDDGNAQGGDIYATHLLPNGNVAPGWAPNGKPISDPADPEEYTSDVGPDGMGGAYFAWEKHGDGHTRSYVTHFDGQGAIFPGWPLGGVSVSSTVSQNGPRVSHDGFTGVLVYWLENAMMAQRFETGGIVATSLALASSDLRSDRVTLLWQGAGASDLSATVYRRTESDGWLRIGSTDREAPDRLRYEDGSVVAGTRYAYRLGYIEGGTEQFTAETWIDVPSADVFALDGLRPNPAVGALNVSFSLPREGAATMELLDLAGRRVLDHEVGQLGRGRHVFRLDSGAHMAPGVYWLRLRQGAQQALTRAVVMR